MLYTLPGIQLETEYELSSFLPFISKGQSDMPIVTLIVKNQAFYPGKILFSAVHKGINVAALEEGWLYIRSDSEDYALHVSADYRKLTAYITGTQICCEKLLPLVRTALECASAAQCVISLHSACVNLEDKAVCFTAPSGTGKSTRAQSWKTAMGAEFISGDRPGIRVTEEGAVACGVPWDGKEQIYTNTEAPLLSICNIRCGPVTRIRRLSVHQAQRVLMQQCFIPMWDTAVAATVMLLIGKLCKNVPVYRVICGPDEDDAREVKEILYDRQEKILEIEKDMKIKSGFVLRDAAGEHVVMPCGQNIGEFDGAIVLNDVAAFVWEKMSDSVSREELLEYILSEFEVDRDLAAKDLDVLLDKLRGYGVIEDESV